MDFSFEMKAIQSAVGEHLLDVGDLPPACAPAQSADERASSLPYGGAPPRSMVGDQPLDVAVLPLEQTLLDPAVSDWGEVPPMHASVWSICCEPRSRSVMPPLPWQSP
jgi:hypothetical protein